MFGALYVQLAFFVARQECCDGHSSSFQREAGPLDSYMCPQRQEDATLALLHMRELLKATTFRILR